MYPIQEVVQELIELIEVNNWKDKFEEAIKSTLQQHVSQVKHIKNLKDYLTWLNDLLHWVPTENYPGKEIYNRLAEFYFIFDQPPLLALQNKIIPRDHALPSTPLSS